MVTQLGRGLGQAHLQGNSLTRRALQGAVGRWALRTRGRLSISPQRGRQSGQDLSAHTRLLEPGMGAHEGECLQHVPELPLEERSPALGIWPARWASWPWTRSGAGGLSRAGRGGPNARPRLGASRGNSAAGGAVDRGP